jgi:4-hydroxy-tetrahydrodipicolinate reductase
MTALLLVGAGQLGSVAATAAVADGVVSSLSGVVDPNADARAAFGHVPGYVSTLDVPAAREGDRALVVFSSRADDTAQAILRLVSAGYHVVTTAEEMAWPPRHIWEALHTAARSHHRAIIMTGANPGFIMDRLPLLAASATRSVKQITVRRRVDSATRRDTLVAKTGRGLTTEELEAAVEDGNVGHLGIMGSAKLLAHTLGWPHHDVTHKLKPLVGDDDLVNGIQQNATLRAGERTIELELVIGWRITDPGDTIIVDGDPPIHLEFPGGYHGDQGAVAQILAALRHCNELTPSFYRPTDLPLRFG